jgi:hypothetical protein
MKVRHPSFAVQRLAELRVIPLVHLWRWRPGAF